MDFIEDKIHTLNESQLKKLIIDNPTAIKHIKNPSFELQKFIIEQDVENIFFIINPHDEIKKMAIEKNPKVITIIKNVDEELEKYSISLDVSLIGRSEYSKNEKLKEWAVRQDPWAIFFIRSPSIKLQKIAIEKIPYLIEHIRFPNEEVQKLAVEKDWRAIRFIDYQEKSVQKLAISKNTNALRYILDMQYMQSGSYVCSKDVLKYALELDFNLISDMLVFINANLIDELKCYAEEMRKKHNGVFDDLALYHMEGFTDQ